MSAIDDCEALILSYIAPRAPVTDAQLAAVATAKAAQAAYEAGVSGALGAFGAVEGVSGLSNGDISVSFSAPRSAGLNERNLAPLARAALSKAGLLDGFMPVARRLP